ncbi:pirin family protein [Alicyclobacillus shizuokensis]|uniref:pirin family protein n=1 Tax=Alicyclobacillus shizuokensis TaxID=392014 RepID=UPI0008348FE4|nr:pirin family protein [Alicyclobacillus shizuokensis]
MNSLQKIERATNPDAMGKMPQRVFPTRRLLYPDPFILLDHFAMTKPDGFPDHPHRGFEIISYVLGGAMAHEDSYGHASVIPTGGVQTVTAGRGLVHSEMPYGDETATGLQLWINLPRADKQLEPSYAEFSPADLPTTSHDGATVTTIVGPTSPVRIHRDILYYDVRLDAGARYEAILPAGRQGFVYLLEGSGRFQLIPVQGDEPAASSSGSASADADAETAGKGDLLNIPNLDGEARLQVTAQDTGVRFAYAAGPPIGERPIYNGPFVD